MPIPYCADCQAGMTGKIRRGRCENCYRRYIAGLKRAGKFESAGRRTSNIQRPQGIRDRIFSQTVPGVGGCVLFTGQLDKGGYASVKTPGNRVARASREIYKAVIGEIPAGLVLDHLCHSEDAGCAGGVQCLHRRCVNPYHLEPVTQAENNLRGLGPTAANARKTHCIHGHEFTAENTRFDAPSADYPNGRRRCRACHRAQRTRAASRSRAVAA